MPSGEERNVFDLSPLSAAVVEDLALLRLGWGESLRLQKIIDAVREAVHVGQHPSYVAPIVFVFRAKHNGFADVFFVTHPFIQESFLFFGICLAPCLPSGSFQIPFGRTRARPVAAIFPPSGEGESAQRNGAYKQVGGRRCSEFALDELWLPLKKNRPQFAASFL